MIYWDCFNEYDGVLLAFSVWHYFFLSILHMYVHHSDVLCFCASCDVDTMYVGHSK